MANIKEDLSDDYPHGPEGPSEDIGEVSVPKGFTSEEWEELTEVPIYHCYLSQYILTLLRFYNRAR